MKKFLLNKEWCTTDVLSGMSIATTFTKDKDNIYNEKAYWVENGKKLESSSSVNKIIITLVDTKTFVITSDSVDKELNMKTWVRTWYKIKSKDEFQGTKTITTVKDLEYGEFGNYNESKHLKFKICDLE